MAADRQASLLAYRYTHMVNGARPLGLTTKALATIERTAIKEIA
jgi:hypothetical protein